MVAPHAAGALVFGPFEFDPANARLLRDGVAVALTPKALELLAFLAARPGRLVTKDELLDGVWGRRFITEGVVKTLVSELRAALGDDARAPRYVETVPRRGYRFVAAVQAPAAPAAAPPPLTAATPNRRAQDLADPRRLLGRDDALQALERLVRAHRLVSVAGPGGVGKTRLALALAERLRPDFGDGIFVLELAAVPPDADAAALRARLTQALGLPAAAAADAASLAGQAAPLRGLLIVDNAEHVAAALAEVLGVLGAPGAALRVLVTTQEPLALPDEQLFRLAPLPVPPAQAGASPAEALQHAAVQLLVARISARLPGFRLTTHQAAPAVEVCRLLDGLPLAIELAAARVPLLGLNGLLDRLHDDADGSRPAQRLALLAQGGRDTAPRHRSLRDTLAWSHALLDAAEQRVFRRLSVFRGGFRLEMAERVCADERLDATGVMDAVSGLVDKSFVVVDAGAGGRHRLALLEGPRLFAAEQLALAEPVQPVQRRHAAAVRDWIEAAASDMAASPVLDWLARHAPDADNLSAALRWALAQPQEAELAAALLLPGARMWMRLGRVDEAQQAFAAVRPRVAAIADPAAADAARGRVALTHALLAIRGGELAAAALAALDAAQDWIDRLSDVDRYDVLHMRYVLMLRAAPDVDRTALLAAAQALEAPAWPRLVTLAGRMDRAHEAGLRGDPRAMLAFARAEAVHLRRDGCAHELWTLAPMLMTGEANEGRLAEAVAIGRAAVAEVRASGRLRVLATTYTAWLQVLAESGATDEVREELREPVPSLLLATGRLWMIALALPLQALHLGRHADAARLLGWRDAAMQRVGSGVSGSYTLRVRALLVERLTAQLGDGPLEALRAEGEALDDATALRIASG
jgi:predicted ATPase/DNA-binding winged helix-turn-helix (wHTH) protein